MTDCTDCGVWVVQTAAGPVTSLLAISGTPPTSATVGSLYSFTPVISGGLGPVTALIANKPSWDAFDPATGQLSGIPPTPGFDSNIIISATDGFVTVSLPPFSITTAAVPVGSSFPLRFMGYA